MMTTQAYDSNILETAEQVRVVWRRVEFKVLIYDERDWGLGRERQFRIV